MKRQAIISTTLILILAFSGQSEQSDPFALRRQEMVRAISADVADTSRRIGRAALNPQVMRVMAIVARHEFVPPRFLGVAYENRPLPIGYGQTISQPYIVALMTDLLEVGPSDRVLEIGAGSGYQAAVLAHLVEKVYTIEIIPELAEEARQRLKRLEYDNVEVITGDGYYGWAEGAPYDAIIVTAAAAHIPPPLIDQLRPGGRMVMPVGPPFLTQQLILVEKEDDGTIRTRQILPVSFVPLTGERRGGE